MEAVLKKIVAFADNAHGDQKRKYADERYIEHPLRVMKTCKDYGYPITVLAAAILHDVLEDTETTPKQIKEFLLTVMNEREASYTLGLVIELTDVYTKHHYPRLNRRGRKTREVTRMENTSAEAQTIKYADIIDNASEIVEHDPDFAPVFLRECKALVKKMEKGNKELREKAIQVVEEERERLRTPDLHP
jgi:guanosine-3',5'-bis(diphosphate) 3'-pyrophosphohydrolase